jgi:ABC-type polysaccharide/polyol phosphate export permease
MLAPVLGEPRAQWVVGRTYALLYLARYYLLAQYAKASLGIFWVALAPLLLAAVYMPIFLYRFQVRLTVVGHEAPVDYALFALVGLILWAAVSEAIGQGAGALVGNVSIVRHAPTPPAMLPIVKVLGSFAGLGIALLVFVFLLAVTGSGVSLRLLLLPPAFVLIFVFTLGLALALSVVAAYVRDVLQMLPTLLAIEFLAAPIVYEAPKTGMLALAIRVNPLTPFLALLRAAIFPWEPFAWADLGLAVAWALGMVLVGAITFRRLEAGLGDVL